MNEFVEAAKRVGQSWARDGRGIRALTGLAGPIIGHQNLKLVSFRGPWSRFYRPILHAEETKELLVWSEILGSVVDLAKLVKTTITAPACYAGMSAVAKLKELPNLTEEVSKFCRGDIDEDRIEMAADLICDRGLFPICATMVAETVARSFPKALV